MPCYKKPDNKCPKVKPQECATVVTKMSAPSKGECLQKEIVYQATTVITKERKETYVGITATEFKTRWHNHQMSLKHENKRNDTELNKYL